MITIDKTIKEVINLASNYPNITKVGIFGSYARGEAEGNSDIDILLDYDEDSNFMKDINNYFEALDNYFESKKLKFDFVSFKGVMGLNEPDIKNSILNDVIWIYEK